MCPSDPGYAANLVARSGYYHCHWTILKQMILALVAKKITLKVAQEVTFEYNIGTQKQQYQSNHEFCIFSLHQLTIPTWMKFHIYICITNIVSWRALQQCIAIQIILWLSVSLYSYYWASMLQFFLNKNVAQNMFLFRVHFIAMLSWYSEQIAARQGFWLTTCGLVKVPHKWIHIMVFCKLINILN